MSKILYRTLGSEFIKKIITDLQKASTKLGVDFFGVGALARNVWYVSNQEPSRGTKDIDFGVYVPNSEIYNHLREMLIKEFSYKEVSDNPFRLMSPYGIALDLLPFGEIENNGKVMIEGKGLIEISLDGFMEAYINGLITMEIEDSEIKICSIPSVVLLKLIAYDDRPEYRQSDPKDINSIINHYPKLEKEMIWEKYSFLYHDGWSHEEVGIKVLGYELSRIIVDNEKLILRVLEILNKALSLSSKLAESMIDNAVTETVESKIKNLKILKDGIKEGLETAINNDH